MVELPFDLTKKGEELVKLLYTKTAFDKWENQDEFVFCVCVNASSDYVAEGLIDYIKSTDAPSTADIAMKSVVLMYEERGEDPYDQNTPSFMEFD